MITPLYLLLLSVLLDLGLDLNLLDLLSHIQLSFNMPQIGQKIEFDIENIFSNGSINK